MNMTTTRTRAQVLAEIAKITRMERGSVTHVEFYGNFHTHTAYENHKSVSRHVTKDAVAELKTLIAAHQKFRSLVEEYEDLVVQETRKYYNAKYPKRRRRNNP